MMLSPYIAAIQIGQLQIQSEYARPVTAIVETAPEIHNPLFDQKTIDKIKAPVSHIEPLQAAELTQLEEVPEPVLKAPNRGVIAPAGWYPKGQCTWLVWTKRDVPGWNDATDWLWQAKRDGWTISDTPVAGAIGWEYGHVVYSERVEGDRVLISEANYDRKGSIRTVWVPASKYTWIY